MEEGGAVERDTVSKYIISQRSSFSLISFSIVPCTAEAATIIMRHPLHPALTKSLVSLHQNLPFLKFTHLNTA
uniref:Uncharacterized protein n=1 Tax=Rhizophora mucronata TaxID=61149 RepID=A0A2P2N8V9_RHIMU